jgi:putative colanic acid biosynthesis acetyltransferase WcaF
MSSVQLGRYDRKDHQPGASFLIRAVWYAACALVFASPWVPSYGLKRWLLRVFGASIGAGVIVKPRVRVKYPWKLTIGRDSWIGEDVWIDNVDTVSIGTDCCVSQGAYLCTGNHDWTDPRFGLVARPIIIGDAVWLGAKTLVGPGVVIGEGAVLCAGSVMVSNAVPWGIYSGNAAVLVKRRNLGEVGRAECSRATDEQSG